MDTRDDDGMSERMDNDGMDSLEPTYSENGHVDEGTIHTWLDGAFDDDASATVEQHVASCVECQSAVAEARGLIAGASRMVRALDAVPANVVPAADVARTASRILAAADATRVATELSMSHTRGAERAVAPTRARGAQSTTRRWSAQRRWSAAAALLVMAGGGGYVWQQIGGDVQIASEVAAPAELVADSVAALTPPAPTGGVAASTNATTTASAKEAPTNRRSSGPDAEARPLASAPPPRPTPVPLQNRAPAPIAAPMARTNELVMAEKSVAAQPATPPATGAASVGNAAADVRVQSSQAAAKVARQSDAEAKRESAAALTSGSASSRSIVGVLAGVVVDSSNAPLQSASVKVVGSSVSTTTNARGEFALQLPTDTATIEVRRLGFVSSRLGVRARGVDTARARVALSPEVLLLTDGGPFGLRALSGPPLVAGGRARAASESAVPRRDDAPPSACWSVPGDRARDELRLPVALLLPEIDGVKLYNVRWIGWPDATTQQVVRMRFENDGTLSGESIAEAQRVRLVLERIVGGWQGTATHTIDGVRASQRVQLKRVAEAMCNP